MNEQIDYTCKVRRRIKKFKKKVGREPNLLILGENDFKEFLNHCDVKNCISKSRVLDDPEILITTEDNIKILRSKVKDEFKFAFVFEAEEDPISRKFL